MFAKILIANRGEIACRVIETARKMGIATVAVYSDADADARHRALADEAVHIGPAPVVRELPPGRSHHRGGAGDRRRGDPSGLRLPVREPRLRRGGRGGRARLHRPVGRLDPGDGAQGRRQGADGRGRRAGGARLPRRAPGRGLPRRGGRRRSAIRCSSRPAPAAAARACGWSSDPADFAAALEGAQREGRSSFGDAGVLIEKYVTTPRHIEVQVFGDSHGHVVHLCERDCSLQRRHQKVIEEAPAPGMPPEVRAAMTEAAVKAARAVDYRERRHDRVHRRRLRAAARPTASGSWR